MSFAPFCGYSFPRHEGYNAGVSQFREKPLHFHTLYQSPLISVEDYCCHIAQSGPGDEEQPGADKIVLMRRGVFRKHFGHRSVTADVNQAIFFSRESSYRVSHPADHGDRGTVLITSPRVLRDIIRELDPAVDEHPNKPFPFVNGPCDNRLFLRHRELVLRLEAAGEKPLEPLWADVTALQLIADVLEAAFVRHGLARKPRRQDTDADHADRVDAARTWLASHMCERVTLDDVAGAANMSPFHFARLFQQRTGAPVHRYLTSLRLRAALERLAEGAEDLTALALELGFSSHSHFTDAFRREFGQAPSFVRRASGRTLGEMRKIPEV
ncbi:MAG: helix-turn-helix transcriptional regulator [Blastocatellia bacterium]